MEPGRKECGRNFMDYHTLFTNSIFKYLPSEEAHTETELAAIAKAPIQGCSLKPNGENTPAANGRINKS